MTNYDGAVYGDHHDPAQEPPEEYLKISTKDEAEIVPGLTLLLRSGDDTGTFRARVNRKKLKQWLLEGDK